MHVTDLHINRTLGMQLSPAGSGRVLEMAESPLLLNHVGTIHASAQFALAEAASGEFLLQQLGEAKDGVFAVLRTSEVKFRKPAHGALGATARFVQGDGSTLAAEVASRGRALSSVLVEIADAQGVVTMTGQFDWFLQKQPGGKPASPGGD
jgi:acyl-coenzyme A thioesterase PaaI-like protein